MRKTVYRFASEIEEYTSGREELLAGCQGRDSAEDVNAICLTSNPSRNQWGCPVIVQVPTEDVLSPQFKAD